MTTKLQALADQLWRKAETTGKAGLPLPHGLYIACYIDQAAQTRTVRFGRVNSWPADAELEICRQPFGIPPDLQYRDYQTATYWVKELVWPAPSTLQGAIS